MSSLEIRAVASPSGQGDAPLLKVEDLRTQFPTERGVVKAVDGVSFQVAYGEIVGIVGRQG
jgi:ABC-type glutathione transport system ATPase component